MSTVTPTVALDRPAAPARRPSPIAIARESLILTGRSLRTIPRVPERLIDVTIQPVIFILLFTYVFGSAIDVPGTSYKDYLFPGLLAQTVAFAVIGTATATAGDLHDGVVDRFKSLPIHRISVLIGQVLGQMFETGIGVVVTIAVGLIVGWTPSMGAGDVLVAIVVLLAFMLASTAIGVLFGLAFKSADAAQGIGFVVVLPLSFMSGTFVPTEGMPKVMQIVGEWNPVAPLVAATRDLTGSVQSSGPWPLEHPVVASLAWTVVLLAICVPLGLRKFKHATTN